MQTASSFDVGTVLPDLSFGPVTRAMLALYAGASGDHNPMHIDSDVAREAGMPDVFAHGMLSMAFLAHAVTDPFGPARLRSFGVRFMAITHLGDRISCRSTVAEKFEAGGETRLRLALQAVNQDGDVKLSGDAVVALN